MPGVGGGSEGCRGSLYSPMCTPRAPPASQGQAGGRGGWGWLQEPGQLEGAQHPQWRCHWTPWGPLSPPADLKIQQTPAWREPHSTGDPGVPPQSQGRFVTPPQSHSGVCLSPPSLSRALCLPLTPGCVCSHLSQLRAGIWGGWEGSSPLGEPRRRGQTPGNCAVPAPGCAGRNGTSP